MFSKTFPTLITGAATNSDSFGCIREARKLPGHQWKRKEIATQFTMKSTRSRMVKMTPMA